ncbi:MAG: hypothetical protein BGO21_08665 [Dyadobacter sp. 50-39]|uniref:hypothetical protein n=1 Tax=Dyadobacter sp. 50-39 TaxID=1895756 RepID=UPI000959C7C1|nr:hypothetical protein [Dyadobacter sp. 50-39]OJV20957.1 MAG: hypothetical protein BGO21_08665 [Dyadobacter sp. 50-39]
MLSDGPVELKYNTRGRNAGKLWKVIVNDVNPAASYYQVFDYSDLLIVKTTYKSLDNTKVGEVHYTLSLSGLCTKSKNLSTGATYIYEYNELNQITKIYNEASPNARSEFQYLADQVGAYQSLFKVHLFNGSNVKYKEISYGYQGMGEGVETVKADKYRINLVAEKQEIPGLSDIYLPIFGKFNTNLLKQVSVKPFPYTGQVVSAIKYFYELESDGLVKTRTRVAFANGLTSNSTGTDYVHGLKYLVPLMQPGGI